jgi:GNAT superfamily N-acetyltransferase
VSTSSQPATYEISFDPRLLDLDVIHGYLSNAYWSPGVPRSVVKKAIDHSLCVGAYINDTQVGFARAITDYATFAYIADVFVLEEHRGRGVGKQLIAALREHPELQGLRTWLLFTRDAHGLYRRFGFAGPEDPNRIMLRREAQVYQR